MADGWSRMAKMIPVYGPPKFIPLTKTKRVRAFLHELISVWRIKGCRKDPLGMLKHAYMMSKSDIVFGEPLRWVRRDE